MQKYSAEESALLDAIKAGEFKSVDNLKEELAKAKQAANNTMTQNKVGGVMMKYIIAWLFLFTISLFAMDNNASRPVKKQTSFLYQMTHIIEEHYIDENNSQKISSQIKQKIFDWYISHCEHNKSETIEDLTTQWNAIEQSCPQMSKSNQHMVFNFILRDYDASIIDMTPYKTKQSFGETGLILNRKNGKITVIGTKDQTSARLKQIPYGTIIQTIDGKPTNNMSLEDVWRILGGSVGSTVSITTNKNISYSLLVREPLSIPNVSNITIGNDIAIIKILSFDNNASKDITKILEQLPPNTNIVLDVRNNLGGLVNSVSDTLSLFVQPNTKLFSHIWRDKHNNTDSISNKNTEYIPKSIYVLINQGTSAGALLLAKVLQKENAIVIGNSQETISQIKVVMPLNETDALKLPIAKFYFPDGTVASGTTVKSDIPFDTNSLDDEALYEKIATIIKNR